MTTYDDIIIGEHRLESDIGTSDRSSATSAGLNLKVQRLAPAHPA